MTRGLVLRCTAFALMLVATQSNAWIDLDSILASLCIVLLRLVMKNCEISNIFAFR